MSGSVPEVCGRARGVTALNGMKFCDGFDMRRQMVLARGRERSADEALDSYRLYLNRVQCDILEAAIDEKETSLVNMR